MDRISTFPWFDDQADPDRVRARRAMQGMTGMTGMTKLDIAALEAAAREGTGERDR